MILLTLNDFSGIYRIDLQPALQQDVSNAIRQVETRILKHLFGRWFNFIQLNPSSFLSQSILDENKIYLPYGYREYMIPIVSDGIYSLLAYRGVINEKEFFERPHSIQARGLLSQIYFKLYEMQNKLLSMTFTTDVNGDFYIDISDPQNFYDNEHVVLPFDIGMEFEDTSGNIYTINNITFTPPIYTYSLGIPNTDLKLRTKLKYYSVNYVSF